MLPDYEVTSTDKQVTKSISGIESRRVNHYLPQVIGKYIYIGEVLILLEIAFLPIQ